MRFGARQCCDKLITAMTSVSDSQKNHLLAALPAADRAAWMPQLEAVDMPLGKVLYESGSKLTHAVSYTHLDVYKRQDCPHNADTSVRYRAFCGEFVQAACAL